MILSTLRASGVFNTSAPKFSGDCIQVSKFVAVFDQLQWHAQARRLVSKARALACSCLVISMDVVRAMSCAWIKKNQSASADSEEERPMNASTEDGRRKNTIARGCFENMRRCSWGVRISSLSRKFCKTNLKSPCTSWSCGKLKIRSGTSIYKLFINFDDFEIVHAYAYCIPEAVPRLSAILGWVLERESRLTKHHFTGTAEALRK